MASFDDTRSTSPDITGTTSTNPLTATDTSTPRTSKVGKKGKKKKGAEKEKDPLPPEYMREIKDLFGIFDKEREGNFPIAQLQSALDGLGFPINDNDIDTMTNDLDPDGVGIIDYKTFLAVVVPMYKQIDFETEMRQAFFIADREKNGFISPADLRHFLVDFGDKVDEYEVDELINKLDMDEFGNITIEDVVQLLKIENLYAV